MSGSTTKFGIRGKIILLALICAVIPSAVISALAIGSSRDALERGIRLELSGLANEQMSRLNSTIGRARTDLGTWATINTMQNALIDDADGIIQGELVGLRKRYESFGELVVLNTAGTVIASALQRNKGLDFSKEEFFSPSVGGKSFQGNVRNQTLTGRAGIAVAIPIRAKLRSKDRHRGSGRRPRLAAHSKRDAQCPCLGRSAGLASSAGFDHRKRRSPVREHGGHPHSDYLAAAFERRQGDGF